MQQRTQQIYDTARLYLEGLASLHLRRRVDDEDVDWLLGASPPARFGPGDRVFVQGEPADHALLVVQGRLEASVQTAEGQRVVGWCGAWDVVGESALYGGAQVRSASVRAIRDTACLRIDRALLGRGQESPVLAAIEYHLLHTLTHRIRLSNAALEKAADLASRATPNLSVADSAGQVGAYLIGFEGSLE